MVLQVLELYPAEQYVQSEIPPLSLLLLYRPLGQHSHVEPVKYFPGPHIHCDGDVEQYPVVVLVPGHKEQPELPVVYLYVPGVQHLHEFV